MDYDMFTSRFILNRRLLMKVLDIEMAKTKQGSIPPHWLFFSIFSMVLIWLLFVQSGSREFISDIRVRYIVTKLWVAGCMYIPFWLEITIHFVEVHFFVIFKLILRSHKYKFHKNTTRLLRIACSIRKLSRWTLEVGRRFALCSLQNPSPSDILPIFDLPHFKKNIYISRQHHKKLPL